MSALLQGGFALATGSCWDEGHLAEAVRNLSQKRGVVKRLKKLSLEAAAENGETQLF